MDEKGATQTADLIHRLCPICGEDNEKEKALNPDVNWNLKKCVQCELVYIEDVPQYQQQQKSFPWQQSWRREKERRQHEEKALHKVQDVLQFWVRRFKRDKLTDLCARLH